MFVLYTVTMVSSVDVRMYYSIHATVGLPLTRERREGECPRLLGSTLLHGAVFDNLRIM